MKSLGIVRRIDSFGRLVLPAEIRKLMEIGEKDPVEFYMDGQNLVVKKYNPCCIFCSSSDNVSLFKGKVICAACRAGIVENKE